MSLFGLVRSLAVAVLLCCAAAEEVGVGKLRAAADESFATGEADKAARMMGEVRRFHENICVKKNSCVSHTGNGFAVDIGV